MTLQFCYAVMMAHIYIFKINKQIKGLLHYQNNWKPVSSSKHGVELWFLLTSESVRVKWKVTLCDRVGWVVMGNLLCMPSEGGGLKAHTNAWLKP